MMRICGVSIMIEPHEMTVTTIMTQSKYGTRPRSFLQKNKITFQHNLQTNKSRQKTTHWIWLYFVLTSFPVVSGSRVARL